MDSEFVKGALLGWLITALICMITVLFLLNHTQYTSYRQGQIDAANGVMKYELVEQDDGETVWTPKEGNCYGKIQ